MKKIIFTLTLTILLVFVGTLALASEGPNVSPKVTPSTTQVSEGGNLSVTLSVDNITFTTGINSATLKIDYDNNIFEPLDDTSFDALNNWTASYIPVSGELTLTRTSEHGLQLDAGDIVKIDFKAKSGTSGETVTIKLKEMTFSDGFSTPFQAEDIVTPSITIGEVQDIPPIIIDPTPIPDPDPDLTPTPVEPETPSDIPETGLTDSIKYIILGLFFVAVIFYINYHRLDKKNVRYVDVE